MPWEAAVAQNMDRTIADLRRLCQQPSISAQGVGIAETVRLVSGQIVDAGGEVQVLDDCGGNPVIYAVFEPAPRASSRTLLYYNHYDVQPPEPLNEWTSPPFAAEIREGKLFARGATDNKGDLAARLAAIRILKENGGLPCRVVLMIEGEEEIGSPTIERVIHRHAPLFKADACIWEFGNVDANGRPQISGGVKGMAYMQLWSRVASVDMHSAMGALVESAGWRLVQALACLKEPAGRIRIAGFYEHVQPPSDLMRQLAAEIPYDAADFKRRLDLTLPLLPERFGQENTYALCFEPTCTICGLEAGYYGKGSKTVLPRTAQAKVDCRLVPNQDPQEICQKVRRHLDAHGFHDIEVSLINGERAYLTDPQDPFVQTVLETAHEAWGTAPVYHPSSAGTGPMYPIGTALQIPIVSTGSGWFGGRSHAPDESIRLADLQRGIMHQVLLLRRFGQ